MMRLSFGSVLLIFLVHGLAQGNDPTLKEQAHVRALVDQVVKAHGGEAALGKIVGYEFMVKGNSFEGDKKTPLGYDMSCQGADKLHSRVFDSESNSEIIEVTSGDEGWTKVGDNEAEKQTDDEVKANIENGYLNWITTVFPLKKDEFTLYELDDISVAGKPAVGLLVHNRKHKDVKLFFDKKSHLLVKVERPMHNPETGADVTEVQVLSNYKTVQGIKQPFKVVTYWDGTVSSDVEMVEFKLHDKPLDEKLFVKP